MSTAIDAAILNDVLNWAYAKAVEGGGGLEPASALAEAHHKPVQTSFEMADEIVRWQLDRTTVTGYFEDLAEKLQVPAEFPQSLATFLYLQLRIHAGIAYGGGKELDNGFVRELAISALLKDAQGEVLEAIGLPKDYVATRASLKEVPAGADQALRAAALPRLAERFSSDVALHAALASVEAPWRDRESVDAMGQAATQRFIVMHTW